MDGSEAASQPPSEQVKDIRSTENDIKDETTVKSVKSMLPVMKYLRESRDSLGPRPSNSEVEAATAAVSSICADLAKEIESLAADMGPLLDGAPLDEHTLLSLRAFKEDVARTRAQMQLLPHVSVLELDRKHRYYEAVLAIVDQCLVSGKWTFAEDIQKLVQLNSGVGQIGDDTTSSALPSPLLALSLPRVFGPAATSTSAHSLAAIGAPVVAPPPAVPAAPSSVVGEAAARPKPSLDLESLTDSHSSKGRLGASSLYSPGSNHGKRAPGGIALATIPSRFSPSAAGFSNFSAVPGTAASGEDGQPSTFHIDPLLLKIIQDSVQSRPRTLDIRGHLFDAPLEYIPETLGFIESLTELHLAENQLVVLPESLGKLKHLSFLDVSCNQLLELPASIGDLTELKELDLHHNKIDELPVTIGGCEELEVLKMEFNNLKALPKAIGQLKKLKKLTLQLNSIVMLPFTIGQLESLVELDVHHNQLQGIPESIGRLGNLEKLNISANHFDLQSLPVSIGQLSSLKELDIRENHIKVLPSSITQLTNLKDLKMDGNPWKVPPMHVIEQGLEAVMEYMSRDPKEGKEEKKGGSHKGGFLGLLLRGAKKGEDAQKLQSWKSHANTWGA